MAYLQRLEVFFIMSNLESIVRKISYEYLNKYSKEEKITFGNILCCNCYKTTYCDRKKCFKR